MSSVKKIKPPSCLSIKEPNQRINIRTRNGDVTCDPSAIYNTFKDFYKSLYMAGKIESDIGSYLDGISLPSISEEARSALDAVFTPEEVWGAVQSMQSGKCPGPDGFPVEKNSSGNFPLEFFKKFWSEIHPIFTGYKQYLSRRGSSVLELCLYQFIVEER